LWIGDHIFLPIVQTKNSMIVTMNDQLRIMTSYYAGRITLQSQQIFQGFDLGLTYHDI